MESGNGFNRKVSVKLFFEVVVESISKLRRKGKLVIFPGAIGWIKTPNNFLVNGLIEPHPSISLLDVGL